MSFNKNHLPGPLACAARRAAQSDTSRTFCCPARRRVWLVAAVVLGLQACAHSSLNVAQPEPHPPSAYLLSESTVAEDGVDRQSGLTDLLAAALATHPAIAAAGADRAAAEAETRIAGALTDPQLSVTQGLTDSDRQTVAVAQRLPLFGQRGLAAEQSAHRARAALAQWQQVRAEVARDVLDAYAEYAYIEAAENTVAQQVALVDQMLDVSRTRYQSGGGAQADLLRMENEKDQLENEQTSLTAMLPVARARLNAALGRPPNSPLPPPELQLLPISHDAQTHLQALIQDSPQLEQLKHELAATETGRRLAARAGLPDLMIGVERMRGGAMDRSETNLMLGINLPIWRGRYAAQESQAEAQHRAVGERMQDRQQMLESEVSLALFSLDEAQRNQALYSDSLVPRGEQAFRVTLSAYRSGTASFADLIASQREWLTFELNRQRSLADALQWQGELIALLGVDSVLGVRQEIQ